MGVDQDFEPNHNRKFGRRREHLDLHPGIDNVAIDLEVLHRIVLGPSDRKVINTASAAIHLHGILPSAHLNVGWYWLIAEALGAFHCRDDRGKIGAFKSLSRAMSSRQDIHRAKKGCCYTIPKELFVASFSLALSPPGPSDQGMERTRKDVSSPTLAL